MKPETIVTVEYLVFFVVIVAMAKMVYEIVSLDVVFGIVFFDTCMKALTVLVLIQIMITLNHFWIESENKKGRRIKHGNYKKGQKKS